MHQPFSFINMRTSLTIASLALFQYASAILLSDQIGKNIRIPAGQSLNIEDSHTVNPLKDNDKVDVGESNGSSVVVNISQNINVEDNGKSKKCCDKEHCDREKGRKPCDYKRNADWPWRKTKNGRENREDGLKLKQIKQTPDNDPIQDVIPDSASNEQAESKKDVKKTFAQTEQGYGFTQRFSDMQRQMEGMMSSMSHGGITSQSSMVV